MKPLSRRSVAASLGAAITALPAVGLGRAVRETPVERVRRIGKELKRAMLDAYGPGEVRVCAWGPHSDEAKLQDMDGLGARVYMIALHPAG